MPPPTGADVERQLTLRIGLRDSATFANFLPGDNAAALHLLQQGGEPFIYLWGAGGSGRSHLLQAACHAVTAGGGSPAYLPLAGLADTGVAMLDGLEQMSLVCLDDLQAVAGNAAWEEALFHLYNRVRDAGGRLLAAADASPVTLGIQLADLRSRLAWGPVFQLQPLDDAGKLAALQLRARARGMDLSEEVGTYLLRRCPRDMQALFELLERLDQASLAAQRRLTIPFVRELIS
ncbi:DnaA regulatory inactivator Hda [Sulfurivermis fontis]|uniref:DnaA regulatory inactivator Hda n=1 Tax=Sulfurivermis fontis TaxID=1972068 RepID=UPI003B831DE0